jgi:hypothetical protein
MFGKNMTALLAQARQSEMIIDVTDLTMHRTALSAAVKMGGAAA